MPENGLTFIAADGLHLSGTLALPDGVRQAAVLVHGGGVTREEGGFFTRLVALSGSAAWASALAMRERK